MKLDQHSLLEMLERRVLLSAAFVATSTNLHDIQNGPLAKAGGNLADLYLNFRSAQRAGTLTTFDKTTAAQTAAPGGSPIDVVKETVGVELVAKGSLTAFVQQMQELGMSVESITPQDNAVAGFIPITVLSQVAQNSNVLHITSLTKPVLSQQGESPNQADQALQAIEARSTFGLTGTGVTVGVISDSVNQVGNGIADSVATGDLPKNVKVIQDGPAGSTDEGRAILEQIYDLAPGANLVFDTVGNNQQSFANAVAALQAAGCNVIIDDVAFFEEPYFQPGIVDKAINNAVNNGVTYVTAAGNNGNSGFEQAATFVAARDASGDHLINFNATGTPATRMNITVAQTGVLTLEWDDAFDGVTATVNADLEILLYSSDGQILEFAGLDNTFATGVPAQEFAVPQGNYQLEIRAVNTPVASLPRYYEFTIDSDAGDAISSTQYPGLRTDVTGHAAFSEAISVGAVDYSSAPPFSAVTPIPTEAFSAAGPAIESRDANGNLLPTGATIDKPDISGTDGNNTSFFGIIGPQDPNKLPQFFGTSSASGNVAGVVALLMQANPSATPAQILDALKTTAVPVNGQTAGTFNVTGGFGLVDTLAAATKLISEKTGSGGSGGGGTTVAPPVATIVSINPDPRATPVSSIDINFSQAVTGFDLADLTLTRNGGLNLLTDNQTLTSSNSKNFVLGNLSSITRTFGDYTLALSASASRITGTKGGVLQIGASTFFVVEAVPGIPVAPINVTGVSDSSGTVAVNFQEPGAGESGFIVQRATAPSFTGKLTIKYLTAGTTSFVDTGLVPGTVYYYRVQAFNADGTSIFSHAATAITLGAGEVILDNSSSKGVSVTGAWSTSTAGSGYDGPNYLQDDNSDKSTKSVKYRPSLSSAGLYDVYATWTTASDHATNVPFSVYSKNGDLLETVHENERSTGGDGFTLIGEFFLHSSTASFVRIGAGGTNGVVVADAIKFLPVGDIPRQDGQLVLKQMAVARVASPAAVVSVSSDENKQLNSLREEVE